MGMELQPDDMQVGMAVTVIEGPECGGHTTVGMDGSVATARTFRDRSYQGDVLRIKAIDLPFIVVNIESRLRLNGIDLDTRRWKFKRLSDEYVAAMLATREGGAA